MTLRARIQDRFELLVAGRLLRSKRSAHLSVISVMSVAGIALGVAALIVVLAVNTGFQAAFQERILSTWPHMVAMRRGLDLRDWRGVTERVGKLPFVRSVNPATYDDMMLSSAEGRSGAVVRGVPASTLRGLPAGIVAVGELDLQGEAPRVSLAGGALKVTDGAAGGRHVVVLNTSDTKPGGPATITVHAVIAPQGELGALLVVGSGACGGAQPEVVLQHTIGGEVSRRSRRKCGVVAQWEVLAGKFELHVQDAEHADTRAPVSVEIEAGRTTVVVVGAHDARVIAPVSDLPPTAAAVAIASFIGEIKLQLPEVADVPTVASAPTWHAFAAQLPTIALGEGLAKKLQVKLGDEVRAVSPLRDDGSGRHASAAGRFRVATIVRTGFYDHDQRLALVDFSAAQRFLGRGDVAHWVDVRIHDPILARSRVPALKGALEPATVEDLLTDAQRMRDKIARVQAEVVPGVEVRKPRHTVDLVDNWISGIRAARQAQTRALSMFRVIDWEEMNRNIFDAARMQKVAMSLFPFIIVLVAALNVIGTQAVIVHERSRDISILRAMGATRRSVGSIFLVQGLSVGMVGTLIGLLFGGLCCLLLDAVGYPLDPHVYLISQLPVRIEASTFVLAGGAATALTFLAALLAARRAAERSPVDGLRRLD